MKVVFDSLPATFTEFTKLPEADLSAPENTCAMFLLALRIYVENRDMGIEAINFLRGPRPLSNYEIQFLDDRLGDKKYLPMAYFDGATPKNNYDPPAPYTIGFLSDPRPQDCEDGYMRLCLKTAGADSPRAIRLRNKNGSWYL